MLYHLVSHSSSGTFDIAYYKRVCARCMSNAVEEFLYFYAYAVDLSPQQRKLTNKKERKEREREREREKENNGDALIRK